MELSNPTGVFRSFTLKATQGPKKRKEKKRKIHPKVCPKIIQNYTQQTVKQKQLLELFLRFKEGYHHKAAQSIHSG
jgi:hypothetical protein